MFKNGQQPMTSPARRMWKGRIKKQRHQPPPLVPKNTVGSWHETYF